MEIKITKDVKSHHTNDDYMCLLVKFSKEDTNFHIDRLDWMPRDDEVIEILEKLFDLSPTFRNKVYDKFFKKIEEEQRHCKFV